MTAMFYQRSEVEAFVRAWRPAQMVSVPGQSTGPGGARIGHAQAGRQIPRVTASTTFSQEGIEP